MSNFTKNLFENDKPFSIKQIIFALFSITIIRAFLDLYSSPDYSNNFFIWKDTYVQFPLYYFWVFLIFGLVLRFFSKKSLDQIVNFEIKIFIFVLIKPITDLIVTGGKGAFTIGMLIPPNEFFAAFFKTMNPFQLYGITFGLHVAAYSIFFLMAVFVYKATKNIFKAFLTVLTSYSILFAFAIIPSLVSLPHYLFNKSLSISATYEQLLRESWIITTSKSALDPFILFQPSNLTLPQYSEPATQVSFLLVIILLLIYALIFKPAFSAAIKKNLRLTRILYWFSIATIGMVMSQKIFGGIDFLNIINILSLIIFLSLIALNAWLAVCINDEEDIEIDRISNPDRPLITKAISLPEWKNFQLILFMLIVLGTGIMNQNVAFLLILAQMSYYMYSAKPYRLKNNFITSSLLIGLSSVAIAMAGFYLVSPDQHIAAFPVSAIFIIGISYALLSNFKDIKDFAGDSHDNILTLPVIFGLKNSKRIIAIIFAIILITVPLLLHAYIMLTQSIFISIFLIYLITKEEYQEKYIFLVFFLYMITFFFVLI